MPHHQHHQHQAADLQKRQGVSIKTVESVVYVTASKTFDGPVAGYSTDMPDSISNRPTPNNPESSQIPQSLASHTPHSTSTPTPSTTLTSSVVVSSSVVPLSSSISSSKSSKTHESKSSSTDSSSMSSSYTDSMSSATQGMESSAPTASPTAEPSNGGMSGGAKAGLAIGLLLLIGLICGLIFFFYRRKKATDGRQRLDDEKTAMQQQHQQPAPLIPRVSIRRPGRETAPRLSLRPLTDLFPGSGDNNNEKQGMMIANGGLAPPAAVHARAPDNKISSIQESPKENPFGDHAELVGTGAGAIDRDAVPKPLNVSRPSTPTGQASPAMAASPRPESPSMGGAAGQNGPLNVHRVQLDFSPSMEDELELRAGQIVRMLHEYDDGWALCIRLDRSQQGVVPRSCLSKQPVKPRPAGPPGSRGPPPPGMRPVRPGHSQMNSQSSIASDASRGNPRMRSQSNQVQGPGAAGPFGSGQYRSGPAPQRPRASTANSNRRDSPPGGMSGSTSPQQGGNMPSRKPVPGQAM